MTTKQAVTKRIQELVPSLMELSFGCVVRIDMRVATSNFHGRKRTVIDYLPQEDVLYVDGVSRFEKYSAEHDVCEILGHPIQLHHVLMATPQILNRNQHEVDGRTKQLCLGDDGTGGEYACAWALTKPLADQEPEVFEFLAEVLGV